MNQRDKNSVRKIAGAMMKLVFPHRTEETAQRDEVQWCLNFGTEMRQRVRDQLSVIAPREYPKLLLVCKSV